MKRARHRRPPRKPAAPPSAPQLVRIERMAAGGEGVGRLEGGKTVFVEGAVPGDLARVELAQERARWARGRVLEVVEPSASRTEPACPHAGVCGGCAWQHVAYPAQVDAKREILRDALERIGRLALPALPRFHASPAPYGYRSRARVRVKAGRPGYLERGSHHHCPVRACPVLVPPLERALLAWPGPDTPEDGEWLLCAGTDGRVSIAPAVHGDAPADVVRLDAGGETVELDARAFSQANALLHTQLVERVIALLSVGVDADSMRRWRLLEIHAGAGFFTLPVARRVAHLVAVEADAHAASWLRRNLSRFGGGGSTVSVHAARFGEVDAAAMHGPFDAVLLDPPRSGLEPDECERLISLAPRRIVYLSCDPATLARDARALVEAGWALTHVEGFDLFPQTPHVEGLIRLERD